jgi:hypothetical protein
VWYGPDHFGTDRVDVQRKLEQQPGRQLAIVRYSSLHNPFNEWVYNSADIDSSNVIWAREMDAANNLDLIRHYKDRTVWLVQPDLQPPEVLPYTASPPLMTASHGRTDRVSSRMQVPDTPSAK